MKNTKKVYLFKYSPRRHTIYEELINYPPKGYSYISEKGMLVSLDTFKNIKNKIGFLSMPLRKIISPLQLMQTLSVVKKIPREAKFVHAADTLFIKKFPWVGDLECVGSYIGHSDKMSESRKKFIEKILSRKECKKIMPFTEYGKKTIEKALDTSKFKDKIEVVHFASKVPKIKVRKDKEKVKIIFVGSSTHQDPLALYSKGAREVIGAFEILSRKYDNLELIMLTRLPKEMEEKIKKIKNIKVLFLPRQETMKIYQQADIFLFPTFLFPGLSFVEALGSGLPIITTNLFGNPEIVENGKNGFLINIPNKIEYKYGSVSISEFEKYIETMSKKNGKYIVKGIVENVSMLVNNTSLRKKMSMYSKKKYGKEFSIEARNRKLKKIYDSI